MQIGLASDISLHRVQNHQPRLKFDNRSPDPFIIQGKSVINIFIDKRDILAVSPNLHKPGFNRVTDTVFRTLVNYPLGLPHCRPIRHRAAGRQLRYDMHHHGGLPVTGVTLDERNLAGSDIWKPDPFHDLRIHVTVQGQQLWFTCHNPLHTPTDTIPVFTLSIILKSRASYC